MSNYLLLLSYLVCTVNCNTYFSIAFLVSYSLCTILHRFVVGVHVRLHDWGHRLLGECVLSPGCGERYWCLHIHSSGWSQTSGSASDYLNIMLKTNASSQRHIGASLFVICNKWIETPQHLCFISCFREYAFINLNVYYNLWQGRLKMMHVLYL